MFLCVQVPWKHACGRVNVCSHVLVSDEEAGYNLNPSIYSYAYFPYKFTQRSRVVIARDRAYTTTRAGMFVLSCSVRT